MMNHLQIKNFMQKKLLNKKDTQNKRNNYQIKASRHSCCERNIQKTREAHVENDLGLTKMLKKMLSCYSVGTTTNILDLTENELL